MITCSIICISISGSVMGEGRREGSEEGGWLGGKGLGDRRRASTSLVFRGSFTMVEVWKALLPALISKRH